MSGVSALTLRHYDANPVIFDTERTYLQADDARQYTKPRGFWVSVQGEDDWPTWCRAEGFGIEGLAVEHEVTLTPDANVLLLSSADMLDAFTKTYGSATFKSYAGYSWTDVAIDWHRVATEYDGLIIAPYQWERRMGLDWYYGWDVASGCIWNAAAIAAVNPLNTSAVTR